jgi:hypothetical protein
MRNLFDILTIEIKRIIKSKVYLLFVIFFMFFALFHTAAVFGFNPALISYPKEEEYKDYNLENIRLEIMTDKIGSLGYEFIKGRYKAAPFGIMKEVVLSKSDSKIIEDILDELIGQEKKEYEPWFQDYNKCRKVIAKIEGEYSINVMKNIPPEINDSITWGQFLVYMEEVSEIIGNGSYYRRVRIEKELSDVKSYEIAVQNYNNLLEKDKIVGAVARVLSDYYGIVLGFLPVMLGVFFVHEDRKYSIRNIIYSKKISSFQIVYSRYFAALIAAMSVVIISLFIPCTFVGIVFLKHGYKVDFLAFAKYSFGWLMPTVMISLAMGFILSELINGIVAIIVQFIWFYGSTLLSDGIIIGNAGYKIIPRFNAFGEYHRFEAFFHELLVNRVSYGIASLVIISITAILFGYKRKGKWRLIGYDHNKE